MLNTLNGLFIAAVLAGTPLLLGALGEILNRKIRKLKSWCRGNDVHGCDHGTGRFVLL